MKANLPSEAPWPLNKAPGAFMHRQYHGGSLFSTVIEGAKELAAGPDNINLFQTERKLGVFLAEYGPSEVWIATREAGFKLQRGDNRIELGLEPIEPKKALDRAEESLGLIAQYIDAHELKPRYVMGMTYERLGKFANRQFGFNLDYLDAENVCPSIALGYLQRSYDKVISPIRDGRDMGKIALVHLETEEFMARFSPELT